MRERWRRLRRASGYKVSDRGRVKSVPRRLADGRWHGGQMLTQFEDGDGYLCVSIGSRRVPVHVLVLEAFTGPCPPGQERLHGPGGQHDNSLANLRYGTHLENERDKRSFRTTRTGRDWLSGLNGMERRTEDREGRVSPPDSAVTPVTGDVLR